MFKKIYQQINLMLRLLVIFIAFSFVSLSAATELVIATVNNGHMIEMQKLTKFFEQENPDISVKWVTLEEGILRQRVTTDITTRGGQFDIMTIGMYEAPIWGQRRWLVPLTFDRGYDVNDILKPMREGLSYDGRLYAAPFYGESSMLMYRKDLTDKAGIEIPEKPTWSFIAEVAEAIHNPSEGVYGICLRGKPGWGDNTAFITTVVNSFGGQWFNRSWKPTIDSPEWRRAVNFYVNLLKNYGPPGSSANSFNEILALFNEGKCGMWVDATIAASFISDPQQSKVANQVAFAQAPYERTKKGSNWLWAWALAIPVGTNKVEEAKKFITWATSKEYIRLVARENGWARVPTGTRKSTYADRNFKNAAVFADAEIAAINTANPNDSTLRRTPYTGVQFVAIPEFQAIGIAVGQQMSAALAGRISVDEALKNSQRAADREMRKSGYY